MKESQPLPALAHRECRELVERLAGTALFSLALSDGQRPVTLAEGYLPLLVDFTVEDREARGLRSLADPYAPPRPAMQSSVLEEADRERLLLILGPGGSGKTTFARHLTLHLAGEVVADPRINCGALRRPVPRNDAGAIADEAFFHAGLLPRLVEATQGLDPGARARVELSGLDHSLLLIDGAEQYGENGAAILEALSEAASRHPTLRVIVLGREETCGSWSLPSTFRRRRLIPLFATQRRLFRGATLRRLGGRVGDPVSGAGPGNPELFIRSIELDPADAPEECSYRLADRWFSRFGEGNPAMREQADARTLAELPAGEIASRYAAEPDRWTGAIRVLADRRGARGESMDPIHAELLALPGDLGLRGAVLAAQSNTVSIESRLGRDVLRALLTIVEGGKLSLPRREAAGRCLSSWGDPRDLESLVSIPGGRFTMGSNAHPNSTPPHEASVGAMRIGRFPVVNRVYRQFVEATGRQWHSKDGRLPERLSAPAVDLSWRDAVAFCDWLTREWRTSGRIEKDDVVRLPTEPEWEFAARSGRSTSAEAIPYPWAGGWSDDRCNSEEAGLNDTCTVGLFPKGESDQGCLDLCGQVWEWCTTLWGEEMTAPSFRYPYAVDGREDADAGPRMRRILRGGSFASGKEKTSATYRGSLEPDGYWRGNGFRVVVKSGIEANLSAAGLRWRGRT